MVTINIFDTSLYVNLPAARIVGLMLIPKSVNLLPYLLRTRAGRSLAIHFLYLAYLGVIFGFLYKLPAIVRAARTSCRLQGRIWLALELPEEGTALQGRF